MKKSLLAIATSIALNVLIQPVVFAEQLGDPNFDPTVNNPAYAEGAGLKVLVDAAHYNWHTIDGRFQAFAKLVQKDGYVIESLPEAFTTENLAGANILVIANAVSETNDTLEKWTLPTPAAFTEDEIQAVLSWVEQGGSLLLIADHLPWPGSTQALAKHFGIIMNNGFAFRNTFFDNPADPAINLIKFWTEGQECNPGTDSSDKWCYGDGYLRVHPIMRGRSADEAIPFVTSFTGQGFVIQSGAGVTPLMILGKNVTQYLPEREDLLRPTTPLEEIMKIPFVMGDGMLQGATLKYGQGRVAVFGEAAMFSAQLSGDAEPYFQMGMNNEEEAPNNVQFTLNVMHWLSGLLPESNYVDCGAQPATVSLDGFKVHVPCAIFESPFDKLSISFDMLYTPTEEDSSLFSVINVQPVE